MGVMKIVLWVVGGLQVGRPVFSQAYREDGLCGPENLAPSGGAAACQHIPPFPTCCQKNGHCGWDCDDVAPSLAVGSSIPRAPAVPSSTFKPAPVQSFTSNGRYRSDGKCGAGNPLENGTPAECDPNSEYFCCSEFGFCGGTAEHCNCDICVNYRPVQLIDGKVRTDRRCGLEFPLSDGSPSECDGQTQNHCCSTHGYCGPGPDHCDCPGCVDYRSGTGEVVPLVEGRVRTDRRCGSSFLLDDGTPSECDGSSENPCCSKWGYCGPGDDHCSCETCKDYRSQSDKNKDWEGTWRKDRRCGNEFPLPDGSGPTECNPDSEMFCCSKWGYCGGDQDHCGCPQCVNYRAKKK